MSAKNSTDLIFLAFWALVNLVHQLCSQWVRAPVPSARTIVTD